MIERFTEGSGLRIRYLDNTPPAPAGRPILFSPGFTDYADEYEDLLRWFLPRRVLVVEVRGRGGSETPPDGFTAAEHVSDLRAVLEEAGIDRFHLMTFSRGTTWGLDLALSDPSRVATISVGDYWAREKGLPVEVADRVLTTRFRGVPVPERVEPHVVTELFRSSVERELYEGVAAIGVPVLVATGTEPGCLLDDAGVQEWCDRVPGVEIVVVPGAAHDLFRPDRLAYPRAVADFIARRAPET